MVREELRQGHSAGGGAVGSNGTHCDFGIEVAPGLIASTSVYQWEGTKRILASIVHNQKTTTPFMRVKLIKLERYHELMELIDKVGVVDLFNAGRIVMTLVDESGNPRAMHFGHLLRDLLQHLPLLVILPYSEGSSVPFGMTKLMRRTGDVDAIRNIYNTLQDVILRQLFCHDERLRTLPLSALRDLAGSAEARKVLVSAVAHLAGSAGRLSRSGLGIGKGCVERSVTAVDASLTQLPLMREKVGVKVYE